MGECIFCKPRDCEHSLSAVSIFAGPEHVHSDQVPLECPETAAPSSHASAYSGDVSNEVLAHLANVHPRVLDDLYTSSLASCSCVRMLKCLS